MTTTTENTEIKAFENAVKALNIEDYKERILKAHPDGKTDHLKHYIKLAELIPKEKHKEFGRWFKTGVTCFDESPVDANLFFYNVKSIFAHFLIKNAIDNIKL